MKPTQNAGTRVRVSHNWFLFNFTSDEEVARANRVAVFVTKPLTFRHSNENCSDARPIRINFDTQANLSNVVNFKENLSGIILKKALSMPCESFGYLEISFLFLLFAESQYKYIVLYHIVLFHFTV